MLERCEGEIVKLLSINSITACFLVTYDGRQDLRICLLSNYGQLA